MRLAFIFVALCLPYTAYSDALPEYNSCVIQKQDTDYCRGFRDGYGVYPIANPPNHGFVMSQQNNESEVSGRRLLPGVTLPGSRLRTLQDLMRAEQIQSDRLPQGNLGAPLIDPTLIERFGPQTEILN